MMQVGEVDCGPVLVEIGTMTPVSRLDLEEGRSSVAC